jgi:glycosyltransferase involved in cell wall biosynthesis
MCGARLRSLLDQAGGGEAAARAFELDLRRGAFGPRGTPHVPSAAVLFDIDRLDESEVTVEQMLTEVGHHLDEALESVRGQTLERLDLVVVDDGSTDDSVELVLAWAREHHGRFNRVRVLRHLANAGLGFARNSGFAAAETPFVLPLDADNRLRPDCAADLLASLRGSRLAFAYPSQERFGDKGGSFGDSPYWPSRLVTGNYIDALGLVAKWAWAAAGGYDHVRHGWEDYDFWCRLAELGLGGMHVAAVLAEYRVHKASMLARSTDVQENKLALVADLRRRHPWLRIPPPG